MASAANTFPVYIKTLAGGFEIIVDPTTTVLELKRLIYEQEPSCRTGAPCLIDFRDTSKPHIVLVDNLTMAGFEANDEINLFMDTSCYPPIQTVIETYNWDGGLVRFKKYSFTLNSYDYVEVPIRRFFARYDSMQGLASNTNNPHVQKRNPDMSQVERTYDLLDGDVCTGIFLGTNIKVGEEGNIMKLNLSLIMNYCEVARNGVKINIEWNWFDYINLPVQYITVCDTSASSSGAKHKKRKSERKSLIKLFKKLRKSLRKLI